MHVHGFFFNHPGHEGDKKERDKLVALVLAATSGRIDGEGEKADHGGGMRKKGPESNLLR